MPARQKTETAVNHIRQYEGIVILAGRNLGAYNYSSIISYSRIVPSSDAEFSDKLKTVSKMDAWQAAEKCDAVIPD